MTRAAILLTSALLVAPASARAQDGRVEVGAGVGWLGKATMGAEPATLTGNDGTPFTLFSTESRLEAATYAAATIGVELSPLVGVEARGTYGRPSLAVRVADDAEGAAGLDVSEPVREFTVAGVLVIHPRSWRIGARAGLFASGGVGYLRHLHDGGGYAEGGRVYLAGGGARIRLGGGTGRVKAAGVRLDAGVEVREGAALLDRATHLSPLAGASLYLRF